MLEIFILFKLGRTISSKARDKGWPGWPFVVIMVFLYGGGVIAGMIAAAVVSELLDLNPNGNGPRDIAEFLVGYLCGAVLGALASYLLVLILPDRSEPEDDHYDDESSDRREQRDHDQPRRVRDRDEDEYDRRLPRAKRADEDDEDGRWKRY